MSASNDDVSLQVNSILYPISYDHSFLQSFVDEGSKNSRSDGKAQSEGIPSLAKAITAKARSNESRAEDVFEARKVRRTNARARQEEVYTDKDRAAAVNMGSEDIKHSLKLKGKREGKDRSLVDDENMGAQSFLVRGLQEMRSGDVKIAFTSINQALQLNPEDKNALIARSKCYLLLGEPLKALKDAEKVLESTSKDSTYARAIYYKAEALYSLGNFEMSLVYYYRGRKIRPELDKFRLGIQKAKNAIRSLLCKK